MATSWTETGYQLRLHHSVRPGTKSALDDAGRWSFDARPLSSASTLTGLDKFYATLPSETFQGPDSF